MKQLLLFLFCSYLSLIVAKCQSISPPLNNEYCPNTEYTFTASLQKPYSSMIGEGGCSVTQSPSGFGSNTITFKGKFADANQKQIFRVYFTDNTSQPFEFKKIKSLFYATLCTPIQPNVGPISVPLCQTANIPISFSNIPWSTNFETPAFCFGSVTNYEYRLPANWKIGSSFTSTGSNWYAGGNSVTITSDLSSGDAGSIIIRPLNTACGTGLVNGQSQAVSIPVSRPLPTVSITGDAAICTGNSSYSINGLPAGASVNWSVSPSGIATLSQTNNIATLTKIANGFVTLTAAITLSCTSSPISLTKSINVGDITTTAQLLGSDCIQQINEMYNMYTANPCNNCTYQWTLLKLGNGNATSSSASITSQIDNTCWVYGTASGGSNAWASYSIGCTIVNACAGTSTTIWHPFKVTPRGGSACNSSSFAAASST